ncbi:hypothetical protein DsansV1_C12g0115411 [Dioscorea sansibarensis]
MDNFLVITLTLTRTKPHGILIYFVLSMVANVPMLSIELVIIYMGNYPASFNPMHGFYFLPFMRSRKMELVHGHQTAVARNNKFMEKKVLVKTMYTTIIIHSCYQTEDLAMKADENTPS